MNEDEECECGGDGFVIQSAELEDGSEIEVARKCNCDGKD